MIGGDLDESLSNPRMMKVPRNHNKETILSNLLLIDSLIMSTYVGEKVVDAIIEDPQFIEFLNNGDSCLDYKWMWPMSTILLLDMRIQ